MSLSDTSPSVSPERKPRGWMRRCLRAFIIYACLPYLAIVAILAVAQRSLIYRPTRTGPLRAQTITIANLDVSDVEIPVDSKVTLRGWHYRAAKADGEGDGFLVIYFGGNAGCRAHRVEDCRDFTRLGCDVLLFDYRGYGDSDGSPSEAALAADAARVWTFAKQKLNYPADRILIFGESLGGAMATRLAAECSLSGNPPAALILNSTFASMVETAAWHYPALPCQYVLLDRFPSRLRMRDVQCPVLQFHGTADDVVPFEHGQRLFDAAPQRSSSGIEKRFVTIVDGQHNFITVDLMQSAVKELLASITDTHD